MQVFHRLEEISPHLTASAVAIGNFDGIHRGHTQLLTQMLGVARRERLRPVVLTFFPHPVEVLNPGKHLERITTTPEKLEILEGLGVEMVLVAPFDRALAALEPEAFLTKFLDTGLHARSIHVGFNFRFGRNRAGGTEELKQFAAPRGMAVAVEEPFAWQGKRVSSTEIREEIRGGKIAAANALLGRPYFISGQVVHGDGRGKQVGFPTANLQIPNDKVLPKNGVYLTRVHWQRQAFASVTNVGVRPTFVAGGKAPVVETHILDFANRIYDEPVRVEFLDRIRDEKKFASLDELVAQIRRDVEFARTERLAYNP